jgi:hypothetical protein
MESRNPYPNRVDNRSFNIIDSDNSGEHILPQKRPGFTEEIEEIEDHLNQESNKYM